MSQYIYCDDIENWTTNLDEVVARCNDAANGHEWEVEGAGTTGIWIVIFY